MKQDKVRIREVNYIFLATTIVNFVASGLIGYLTYQKIIHLTVMESLVFSQIIFIIPALVYVIRYRINVKEFIRLKPIKITTAIMLVFFIFLTRYFISVIDLISRLFASSTTTDVMSNGIKGAPFIVSILIVAVLPAICEESVYRGVFYNEYSKVNTKKAIILSGFLFGIFHMNINQFAYAFIMGIIFALVIEATDSIVASMICHFTMNAQSVVASYSQLTNKATQVQLSLPEQIKTIAIISIIPTLCAIWLFILIARNEGRLDHIKAIFRKSQPDQVTPDRRSLITKPLLACIIICCAYMILAEIKM